MCVLGIGGKIIKWWGGGCSRGGKGEVLNLLLDQGNRNRKGKKQFCFGGVVVSVGVGR
jgi:hypothetical protein